MNLEDYYTRIQRVETQTNFTKNTLDDIRTRIDDLEREGNLTMDSVQDVSMRLADVTGELCSNGLYYSCFKIDRIFY